jgi:hypothetical protein
VDQRAQLEEFGSAFGVQIELIAHHVLVDAMREMLAQTVGEGEQQIIYALLVQDPRQNATRLSAIVLAQELADLLHGDIALEIQVEILE